MCYLKKGKPLGYKSGKLLGEARYFLPYLKIRSKKSKQLWEKGEKLFLFCSHCYSALYVALRFFSGMPVHPSKQSRLS